MNSHSMARQAGIALTLWITVFLWILAPAAFSGQGNSVETLRETGRTFARIAEQTAGAVVGIQAEQTVDSRQGVPPEWPYEDFGENFFDWFFRQTPPGAPQQEPPQRRQMAQGSGFIISPDGHIITNYHVVGNAREITVQMSDDRTQQATLIGADPESDVALIKIDGANLPTLELADSDQVEVGEWVMAVGNPFGLSHSVTAGIVSAKSRTGVGVAAYEDFLQTDAAINPGNSGGPLVNLDGKVIGVNTAIISRTGGNLGIGLAIPSNMVKYVYEQLLDEGEVVRGYLGVSIQDLTPSLARAFGIENAEGVLIPSVTPGSAADKAGIQKGDVILSLGGQNVRSADELRNRVAMYKPGTEIEVQVLRDGRTRQMEVEIGRRPSSEQPDMRSGQQGQPDDLTQNLGLVVQNLTDDLARRFEYEGQEGVIVTQVQPGSLAAQAGLQAGMLITEVNRKPVSNTRQFARAVNQERDGDSILLLVSTGQVSQYVTIELPK